MVRLDETDGHSWSDSLYGMLSSAHRFFRAARPTTGPSGKAAAEVAVVKLCVSMYRLYHRQRRHNPNPELRLAKGTRSSGEFESESESRQEQRCLGSHRLVLRLLRPQPPSLYVLGRKGRCVCAEQEGPSDV
jgi:hypothetical protein